MTVFGGDMYHLDGHHVVMIIIAVPMGDLLDLCELGRIIACQVVVYACSGEICRGWMKPITCTLPRGCLSGLNMRDESILQQMQLV